MLYPVNKDGEICAQFQAEAECLYSKGFTVHPQSENPSHFDKVIYRGFAICNSDRYPSCHNIINTWEANKRTLYMSEYLHIIKNWTIPTFFVASLDAKEIIPKMKARGWKKIFVKRDSVSLFAVGENASVWPDTSFETITDLYDQIGVTGPFAIRKYIDDPEIFYNEQRYWVLNGHVYHPNGIIPDFVAEAGRRMYAFSGSHYFTIDVAGDYIVEVNPGESSDRGGDNSLDFFCEIFAKEFLK